MFTTATTASRTTSIHGALLITGLIAASLAVAISTSYNLAGPVACLIAGCTMAKTIDSLLPLPAFFFLLTAITLLN